MSNRVSSIEDVLAALTAAQKAVREEIAARIAAGETIGRIENGQVITSGPPSRDLNARRRELLAQYRASNGKT